MRILVSNDDGVHAEGIRALSEALRACGEVIVVAPDRNRSGASHSLTLEVPLRVTRIAENGFNGCESYAVKGTPTDCVHLAVNELVRPEPDMVVAGINHGANLGDDVIYSGTVAAATEGRHLGYPSIAISLVGKTHFATAAHYAALLVKGLMKHPLPADQNPQRQRAGLAPRADQGDQDHPPWQSPPGGVGDLHRGSPWPAHLLDRPPR